MPKPSFYCENCGRKVPAGLDVCPGCGELFSSVRCPSCGYTGEPGFFKKSCPHCGFTGKDVIDNSLNKKNYNIGLITKNFLPAWVYRVLITALIILIIYLIRVYFSL